MAKDPVGCVLIPNSDFLNIMTSIENQFAD